ncbi:choice-of-anchor J domain-containing protein, partial [Neptunitalea chrysea]|uniref:choice-of-anchor J domain-containing protein n=1 Tax=Neptunitalea chrysea TaxID=1647581 RepID=UPI0024923F82
LNDAANWPNVAWSVTGSYSNVSALFESDPTTTSNFAYDDNAGGSGSSNSIAAESPYLNLNGAFAAGETYLYADFTYIYHHQNTEMLSVEYWDADASVWVNWVILDDTGSAVTNNYCADTGSAVDYTTPELDISGFTTGQLSAFRYRILYDDNNIWARGFCVSSPTIYSGAPPTCPAISGITVDSNTDSTVTLSWLLGGTENQWEVVVQPAGTGVPTGSGTTASTNDSFLFTSLTANTTYEVYVRADCSGGDYSVWVGPITFTTYDVPPTAPTGVTCATGNGSYIFTEDFDAVGDWTGAINSNGGSWEIPDGSTSVGTGPAAAYNGASFMNFEASGAATGTSGSVVSPVIDLTTATGAVELSFYMHAFGPVMGTLEVGVSTSATGPFTNEFTWVGDYQASATQPWVPVGIDLTAYAGQNIYIEFKQTSAGSLGDMSIDFMRVEACGDYCIAPSSITATDITDVQAVLDWIANNGESSWEVVV